MRRPRRSERLLRPERSPLSRLRPSRTLLPIPLRSPLVPLRPLATTPGPAWRNRSSSQQWVRGESTSTRRDRTRLSTSPFPRGLPPPRRAGAHCRRLRPWRSPRSRRASWRRSTCRWRLWTTTPTGPRTPAPSLRRCPRVSRSRSALREDPPRTPRRGATRTGRRSRRLARTPVGRRLRSSLPAPTTIERTSLRAPSRTRRRLRRPLRPPRSPPPSRRKPSVRSPPCRHRRPALPTSLPSDRLEPRRRPSPHAVV